MAFSYLSLPTSLHLFISLTECVRARMKACIYQTDHLSTYLRQSRRFITSHLGWLGGRWSASDFGQWGEKFSQRDSLGLQREGWWTVSWWGETKTKALNVKNKRVWFWVASLCNSETRFLSMLPVNPASPAHGWTRRTHQWLLAQTCRCLHSAGPFVSMWTSCPCEYCIEA